MSENLSYLSGRKGLKENLFERLGDAAQASGTPELDKLEQLRKEFLIGKSSVYGAASFYDFLKPENVGKKIYYCSGSACMTAGTQDQLKKEILHHFNSEEIGAMCCLGRCHENHAFHFNGKNYSGKDGLRLLKEGTLRTQSGGTIDPYQVKSLGRSVLTQSKSDLNSFRNWFDKAASLGVDQWMEEIKKSGLRGRGGAGFSTAFKLDACRKAKGTEKFIVCNADEGDPGAFSDRYLLEQQPLLVLGGMLLAGMVTGATWGVVYIRGEYPESVEVISKTVIDLEKAGLIGNNIRNTGTSFQFKVIKAQGAYICGEETALLSSIEGQRPEVRVRPPYPAVHGLFNQPTVVSNVETLANLPFILENGGLEFSKIGRGKSTGTKLVSLDGFFKTPGIVEAEMGTSLDQILTKAGGGYRVPIKALHIGGPLGGLVPINRSKELSLDFESFTENGFLLGHASVVCIPSEFPLIKYLTHLFEFTAHESCGKCFPCRLGSQRGAEMFKKAEEGEYRIDRKLLDDLLETLESGSLCMLGGGLPLPIRNSLEYFSEELATYLTPETNA